MVSKLDYFETLRPLRAHEYDKSPVVELTLLFRITHRCALKRDAASPNSTSVRIAEEKESLAPVSSNSFLWYSFTRSLSSGPILICVNSFGFNFGCFLGLDAM
jgi:hypothetical protein